jgi:hypothetical protein
VNLDVLVDRLRPGGLLVSPVHDAARVPGHPELSSVTLAMDGGVVISVKSWGEVEALSTLTSALRGADFNFRADQ